MAKFYPFNNKNLKIDSDMADIIIKYSIKPTEFEVQSRLYEGLKHILMLDDNNCDIKSEVTVHIDNDITARFDLMVFKLEVPICCIEVKRNNYSNQVINNKQKAKYNYFSICAGVPVLFCYGMNDIPSIIEQVSTWL